MALVKKSKSFFIALYNLFTAAGNGFMEDRVLKLSAALAYYTIFALTPLIIIMISAASLFLGDKMNPGTELFGEISEMVGADAAAQLKSFVDQSNLQGKSTFGLITGVIILIIGATAIFKIV
jgi:membrane protein